MLIKLLLVIAVLSVINLHAADLDHTNIPGQDWPLDKPVTRNIKWQNMWCWMTSGMQVLARIKPITNLLISDLESGKLQKNSLNEKLAILLKAMFDQEKIDIPVTDEFKNFYEAYLASKIDTFGIDENKSHDSTVFLQSLINNYLIKKYPQLMPYLGGYNILYPEKQHLGVAFGPYYGDDYSLENIFRNFDIGISPSHYFFLHPCNPKAIPLYVTLQRERQEKELYEFKAIITTGGHSEALIKEENGTFWHYGALSSYTREIADFNTFVRSHRTHFPLYHRIFSDIGISKDFIFQGSYAPITPEEQLFTLTLWLQELKKTMVQLKEKLTTLANSLTSLKKALKNS